MGDPLFSVHPVNVDFNEKIRLFAVLTPLSPGSIDRRSPRPRWLQKRRPRLSDERIMANTSSAKKMVRKIAQRTAVNKSRRSRVRSFLRKVEEAIASGDKSAAETALKSAQPELHRAVSKGVFHQKTVARKLSRLSARVKALAA